MAEQHVLSLWANGVHVADTREAARLCKLAKKSAQAVLDGAAYLPEEQPFGQRIVDFVIRQVDWLNHVTELASDFPTDTLTPFNPQADD